MSLTSDDLKAIRKVIREEVTTEVKDSSKTLESQIRFTKIEIKNGIRELDDRVKNVEIRVESLHEDTKEIKKQVKKTAINVEDVLGFLDAKDVELVKRVTKIEKHLNLPQN